MVIAIRTLFLKCLKYFEFYSGWTVENIINITLSFRGDYGNRQIL